MQTATLPQRELQFLNEAAQYLEKPSFLMRIADMVGQPLEKLASSVVPDKVAQVGTNALKKAMEWASTTVPTQSEIEDDFRTSVNAASKTGTMHKIATAAAGAVSGFIGLPGVLIELPLTTGLMFRSIASIAQSFGQDIRNPEVRLECLSIFSQGGPNPDDDAMESTYLTTRLAMTALIQDASRFLAGASAKEVSEAVARGTAPTLVRFITRVAAQFNVVVSEKVIAQGLPVIGAGTGAFINAAFSDHFNSVARYHFGMRKLEREYGTEVVQELYRAEVRRLKSAPA